MADLRLPEHPDQRLTRSVLRRSNGGSRRSTDPHRDAALRTALSERRVVISGGPGCGRTALLQAVIAHAADDTLVAVDDVQHADAETMEFLLGLQRFPQVRVVVTHAATDSPWRAALSTWTQVWLRPLSPDSELHALSGGNPAVLGALRDDGGQVGPITRRTFVDVLRRQDSALFEVACGLAVLGPHATPALLGALTGRHQESAAALTTTIAESGLLDGQRFRLPGAATILLGALPPDKATALYRKAALLLHETGAPDLAVAEQCVAANSAVAGTSLLRRAARSADPLLAVDCLWLALRAQDEPAVRLELGQAQWQVDPAAAARTLLPHRTLDEPVLRARWWRGDFTRGIPERPSAELSLCHEFITGKPLVTTDPERVLQCRHDGSAPEALVQAVRKLSDRTRFEHWMSQLTDRQDLITLQALASCARAEDSWRRGDAAAAAEAARTALTRLNGWGVVIAYPLEFALLAAAALGQELPETRVPDAVHNTAFGPRYLSARGHHHLAFGRPHAALDDFTAAADRLGIAETKLALGHPRLAKSLLDDIAATTRDPRTLGVALRLLARVSSRADRPRLLANAVRQLEIAGDRRELSRALADLGRDRQERGVLSEARLLIRRSRRESGLPERRPTAAPNVLTGAETKVAALAAAGHSNREIGDRLCVTVSTVEQHLTRIYRKLAVTGRDDLPRGLFTT